MLQVGSFVELQHKVSRPVVNIAQAGEAAHGQGAMDLRSRDSPQPDHVHVELDVGPVRAAVGAALRLDVPGCFQIGQVVAHHGHGHAAQHMQVVHPLGDGSRLQRSGALGQDAHHHVAHELAAVVQMERQGQGHHVGCALVHVIQGPV